MPKAGEAVLIIQARMGSQRLPGKVLMNIAGKPLLEHLLDAARRVADPGRILLATSVASEDDAVEKFARDRGVRVFRGDEKNVALRFLEAIRLRALRPS